MSAESDLAAYEAHYRALIARKQAEVQAEFAENRRRRAQEDADRAAVDREIEREVAERYRLFGRNPNVRLPTAAENGYGYQY